MKVVQIKYSKNYHHRQAMLKKASVWLPMVLASTHQTLEYIFPNRCVMGAVAN
jgi:hypothetical protein